MVIFFFFYYSYIPIRNFFAKIQSYIAIHSYMYVQVANFKVILLMIASTIHKRNFIEITICEQTLKQKNNV